MLFVTLITVAAIIGVSSAPLRASAPSAKFPTPSSAASSR